MKCVFHDVRGQVCVLIEKIPVVSVADLSENTPYPVTSSIACTVIKQFSINGKEAVTIDLSRPYGISDENGTEVFDVYKKEMIIF